MNGDIVIPEEAFQRAVSDAIQEVLTTKSDIINQSLQKSIYEYGQKQLENQTKMHDTLTQIINMENKVQKLQSEITEKANLEIKINNDKYLRNNIIAVLSIIALIIAAIAIVFSERFVSLYQQLDTSRNKLIELQSGVAEKTKDLQTITEQINTLNGIFKTGSDVTTIGTQISNSLTDLNTRLTELEKGFKEFKGNIKSSSLKNP
jgi:hypothetical protein